MIRIKNANGKVFDFDIRGGKYFVDGKTVEANVVKIADGKFHVLLGTKSFSADVLSADRAAKTFVLRVNNSIHELRVEDEMDSLLKKLGMDSAATHKVNDLKAPMPGLVLKLMVAAGDEIKLGDPLLLLEAMKMENILKAAGIGKVKAIKVAAGDKVEKGQVLIQFEK